MQRGERCDMQRGEVRHAAGRGLRVAGRRTFRRAQGAVHDELHAGFQLAAALVGRQRGQPAPHVERLQPLLQPHHVVEVHLVPGIHPDRKIACSMARELQALSDGPGSVVTAITSAFSPRTCDNRLCSV